MFFVEDITCSSFVIRIIYFAKYIMLAAPIFVV